MKSSLIYYLTKAILIFFSWFSLPVNHYFGKLLGKLFYFFNNPAKKISSINIRACFPQLTDQEHQLMLKKNMIELGKTMTELGPVWLWPAEKILQQLHVEGEELVLAALQEKRGVILITPHLGCWEMSGLYVGYRFKCTSIYQSPKINSLDPILRQARERGGGKLLSADNRGLAALLKALRKGQAIGMLPDQTPKELSSGTFAAFFKRPALTINLLASLARKSGAAVFICFANRQAKGQGYKLHFYPAEADIDSKDNLISARALNQSVELLINQAPEQYLWSYKRFKQVAQGLDKIY
ncbi:MAG: lysophospholipid acyltransferase family protein [Pseudomonadota bacterium]